MKRGFTLLEVMLALAIFALAATAVLQIASGALSNQQLSLIHISEPTRPY